MRADSRRVEADSDCFPHFDIDIKHAKLFWRKLVSYQLRIQSLLCICGTVTKKNVIIPKCASPSQFASKLALASPLSMPFLGH